MLQRRRHSKYDYDEVKWKKKRKKGVAVNPVRFCSISCEWDTQENCSKHPLVRNGVALNITSVKCTNNSIYYQSTHFQKYKSVIVTAFVENGRRKQLVHSEDAGLGRLIKAKPTESLRINGSTKRI